MFDGLDNGMQALFIAPTDLVRWADRVRPHLDRMAAASDGCYETCDILAALAAGRMFLWIALDGADLACVLVTEIVAFPRRRAMRCIGISGHRPRRWMPLLFHVERAAKEWFGCDKMQSLHQRHHGKLLRTGGWTETHVLSEKSL